MSDDWQDYEGQPGKTEYEHSRIEGWTFTMHLTNEADNDALIHELAHVVQRVKFGVDDEQHGDNYGRISAALFGALGQPDTTLGDTASADE